MYNYKRKVSLSYEDAVEKVKSSLKEEGFGIITEIDVKKTIKEKLNKDFGKYLILGVCNPTFAHQALLAEIDIGVLLPCNVIIYENEGSTYAACILPTIQLGKVDNENLDSTAIDVESKLKKAIDSL